MIRSSVHQLLALLLLSASQSAMAQATPASIPPAEQQDPQSANLTVDQEITPELLQACQRGLAYLKTQQNDEVYETLFIFIRPVVLRDPAFADLLQLSATDARKAKVSQADSPTNPLKLLTPEITDLTGALP